MALEMTLYFNRLYTALYLLVTFLVFIYKGLNLPYPTSTIVGEMILLVVVCIIDHCRVFLASRGNKTERFFSLAYSIILMIFSLVGFVYFLRLQVYVLKIGHHKLDSNGIPNRRLLFHFDGHVQCDTTHDIELCIQGSSIRGMVGDCRLHDCGVFMVA